MVAQPWNVATYFERSSKLNSLKSSLKCQPRPPNPTQFMSMYRAVCACLHSYTVCDEMFRHMENYSHGEAAGEVRGVHQANHAADNTDQSQGGFIDGAPWGTCCRKKMHNNKGICEAVSPCYASSTTPTWHKNTCTAPQIHRYRLHNKSFYKQLPNSKNELMLLKNNLNQKPQALG